MISNSFIALSVQPTKFHELNKDIKKYKSVSAEVHSFSCLKGKK